MSSIIIQGGTPLRGAITIAGCKNSVLPIMAATILAEQCINLSNVPQLRDVNTMMTLLASLNLNCRWQNSHRVKITPACSQAKDAVPYELMQQMRASILVLGPLLSRYGHALVSMPGGCSLGLRPIDVHLQGLRAMGAEIHLNHGNLRAVAPRGLHGSNMTLPTVTVTGTENLMMAATLARGTTTLHNAAREPEIVDLANFLNQIGGKITGAGSSCITIEGVKNLQGGDYHIMPDRIEAATWLCAAMATGGDMTVEAVVPAHLDPLLLKLVEAGASISVDNSTVSLNMSRRRPLAIDITTAPFPGFSTDMQPALTAMNTIAEGESYIVETLFENRFLFIPELMRMGADITLRGQVAHCRGVKTLTAAPVAATDLRAAASLMIAALSAEGETVINHIEHIDRGYANIEQKLTLLGANVTRIEQNISQMEHDYDRQRLATELSE